jgi:ABC-type sugar transport system permease subunit
MKSAIVSATLLSSEHPTRRIRRVRLNAAWGASGLLAPSAVFLLAFTYWPVLRALADSLTVRSFRGAAHWGLDNFSRLFADPHFTRGSSTP